MLPAIVVAVSLLVQLAAAVLALRLVGMTGRRLAWMLIAAAILLMALRRAITLGRILSGDPDHPPDPGAELVALTISVLMLAGISAVAPLQRTLRASSRAFEESAELLRQVVTGLPIVLFSLDRDGVLTLSEGKGLQTLGLEPGEAVGRSVFDLYAGVPAMQRNVRRALAGEELRDSVELEDAVFDTRYSPIRGADGEVTGVIGVAVDITERERLERRLAQSQRLQAVGRLAGGIAHDFNNLLTAILGHCELLLADLPDDDPRRADVDAIRVGARSATSLTQQLLAFSRRQVMQPRVIGLNAVVSEMDTMLRRVIGEDIDLVTALAEGLGNVEADPGQIEQLIVNLVVNARDAMPRGGPLTIETKNVELDAAHVREHAGASTGPHVMLAVSDTGAGMDEETRGRIFEPFFTTKGRGEGTGLGLATVYGIVKQSDGDIWVYSEPGQGTTFKIYLPQVDRHADRARRREPRTDVGGTETILLVEDAAPVQAVVREGLERNGYNVLTADSAEQALELASGYEDVIDLLVTDVVLPDLGGRGLAERLSEARPGMRVLYISGYTDDAIVRRGVLEADTPFLQKPFTPGRLAAMVRELLDSPGR